MTEKFRRLTRAPPPTFQVQSRDGDQKEEAQLQELGACVPANGASVGDVPGPIHLPPLDNLQPPRLIRQQAVRCEACSCLRWLWSRAQAETFFAIRFQLEFRRGVSIHRGDQAFFYSNEAEFLQTVHRLLCPNGNQCVDYRNWFGARLSQLQSSHGNITEGDDMPQRWGNVVNRGTGGGSKNKKKGIQPPPGLPQRQNVFVDETPLMVFKPGETFAAFKGEYYTQQGHNWVSLNGECVPARYTVAEGTFCGQRIADPLGTMVYFANHPGRIAIFPFRFVQHSEVTPQASGWVYTPAMSKLRSSFAACVPTDSTIRSYINRLTQDYGDTEEKKRIPHPILVNTAFVYAAEMKLVTEGVSRFGAGQRPS